MKRLEKSGRFFYAYTIYLKRMRNKDIPNKKDMSKTFTLPQNLRTATAAITDHDPCELLYQSQLMNFLSEEFEGISFSPDQSVVDSVLAYSKAVEVKQSSTMIDGHQIVMN